MDDGQWTTDRYGVCHCLLFLVCCRRMVPGCLFVLSILVGPSVWAKDWFPHEHDGIVLHVQTPDSSRASGLLASLLMERRAVLRKLGDVSPVPMTVYIAPSQAVFDDLTKGRLPHWSAAVAFPGTRTVVLKSVRGQRDEWLRVVRHEMAHILLHATIPVRMPTWFDEGVSMWASQEWRFGQTTAVLYAVLSGGLIALSDIDSVLSFPSVKADLAYTESLLAVTYLMNLGGPNAVPAMISEMMNGVSFDVALFRITGETPLSFERRWADEVVGQFGVVSFLLSVDALWFYLVILVFLSYAGVKWRNRARLRQWEAEDALDVAPPTLQVHQRENEP